ncbi:MAG: hypothetical protein FJ264_17905 [Planctomycetes bacterium]|nr:hypothetical protein [Planctomycetota bacterium]MBM4066168.1 hypothetical protein [Planctomycetota bacterium]
MKTEYNKIYAKLYQIYKKYQKAYKHNPDSHQMCCMWSTVNPPDTIEDTKQIRDIEKAFDICLNEMEALELYDMNLDEAAKRILEMKEGKSSN